MRRNYHATVFLLSLCLVWCDPCTTLAEDVVYQDPVDIPVRSVWNDSDDGFFRVFPNEYDLDLNEDGISDLRFRHSHMPRSRRIDSEAVELLRLAEGGIGESLEIVRGLRVLSIEAANEGVNDEDRLSQLQAQVENGIATLARISNIEWDSRGVLDGSRGFGAVSSASRNVIEAASASSDTVPGSYTVDITTAAERASVEAVAAQSAPLAADETMVINGISVDLFVGMTQSQVVDRINDFASQTGVYADITGRGSTRLYTVQFGSNAVVAAIADRPASSDSSGFGTAVPLISDTGVDVRAVIGSKEYAGSGNTVKATTGAEKGITLRVGASDLNGAKSVYGPIGTIDVVDNSPVFTVDSATGESLRISLPNIEPSTLGNSFPGNQFASLMEIRVNSAAQANDSLGVIDQSIDQLEKFHWEIDEFLAVNAYPYGVGTLQALNGAGYATSDFGLLPAGVQVGSDLDFAADSLLLQDSDVFQALHQNGFLGVRTPVLGGWIYGWVGLAVDEDSSIAISDYAWNSRPNLPVVTGVASALDHPLRFPGDANADGIVNFQDFLILADNFDSLAVWAGGDFTGDGFVQFDDFLSLAANFEHSPTLVAIPERSALAQHWFSLFVYWVVLRFRPNGRRI